MIGVERLTKILRVCAVSGLVKNASPISLVLVAPSDAGKSELILATLPPNARVINDFTTASLTTILNEPKPPTWIVVPDFNAVISHKPAVATLTMAFLLALLAEGVTEIPGVDADAKLKAKFFKKRGLRIALLTGMTPDMFYSSRGKWRSTGLLRRLVPVNYTYSDDTRDKIQQTIQSGVDALNYAQKRQARIKPAAVKIPAKIAEAIRGLSEHIVTNQLVWRYRHNDGSERLKRGHDFPFSMQKMLRVYVRAHALTHSRAICTRADFDGTKDFSKFIRYDRAEPL